MKKKTLVPAILIVFVVMFALVAGFNMHRISSLNTVAEEHIGVLSTTANNNPFTVVPTPTPPTQPTVNNPPVDEDCDCAWAYNDFDSCVCDCPVFNDGVRAGLARHHIPITRLFGEMPGVITPADNNARSIEMPNGVRLHACWCYSLRVRDYDPAFPWNGEEYEGIRIWQDPETLNLVLSEPGKSIAFFDYENTITSTLTFEGTRGHRFATWSVYFFADGNTSAVFAGSPPNSQLMTDWVWDMDEWNRTDLPLTWEELIQIDNEFMMRVTSLLIDWR
jgi:hypothetical protein